ncbi:MAG: hypothetical protein IPM81_11310 [Saprospirales bacterium]|nr:hypothetical protein [Saprospirales bacterium]
MNDIIFRGIATGFRQWRIVAIVYALQLCLALTLGMQAYEVLEASIGHSLELHKLLQGYDHTVLTDFLNVHGASITPLLGQLRWLALVWLFFSVFIQGGMLYCAASAERISGRAFWQGGAAYFLAFLPLALFFLALALVWTAVLWLPAAAGLGWALEELPSEKYAVWGAVFLFFVWLSGLAVLFAWAALSRLHHIRRGGRFGGMIKNGFRAFWRDKTRCLGLLAAFGGIFLLLTLVYWTAGSYGGMTSPGMILVFFGAQQAFVFARIALRQMAYAALARIMAA